MVFKYNDCFIQFLFLKMIMWTVLDSVKSRAGEEQWVVEHVLVFYFF